MSYFRLLRTLPFTIPIAIGRAISPFVRTKIGLQK